ncbi:MAG: alkaline phosphatase [Holophagales bacterium]|nr:alkaline phosphatase [Holophagales bacterium]MYG29287.1 alkaline phosphatase [Holophagales bacterium]MYI81143.1 alkaline phosphatase [Holophagales bacterium]
MRLIRSFVALVLLAGAAAAQPTGDAADAVFLASGVRVGEVGATSAVVWTRTTAEAQRRSGAEISGRPVVALAPGVDVSSLEGAVPGAPGELRVVLRSAVPADEAGDIATTGISGWHPTGAERDFTHQVTFDGLTPNTRYLVTVQARPAGGDGEAPATAIETATFRTAPASDQRLPVRFAAMTCQYYGRRDRPDGFRIYPSMAAGRPDFYLSIGDNVYYDNESPRTTSLELARYHWQRMFTLPAIASFLRSVPGYWLKDDHDLLRNDSWPGIEPGISAPMTFEEGQAVFVEQMPAPERPYRTVRWGKGLQLWLVEGRDFRSPNDMPDGPGKTIWGTEQWRWLRDSLLASDADWKVLVSPTPIVGPDRSNKADNHANAAFSHEGDAIREWFRANLDDSFLVIVGDRHWQYHSVHPETGLDEFSVGPASDAHAGGTPGEDPEYHRFHRVGGGFLSVDIDWVDDRPRIVLRHRDVSGRVVYEIERLGS